MTQLATNLRQVPVSRPLGDYPFRPTPFEIRAELGEPQVMQTSDDTIEVYEAVPGHHEWFVTAAFYIGQNRLELLAVAVRASSGATWPPPGVPLTVPVLRAVRVGNLYQAARGWLSISQEVGLEVPADAGQLHKRPRPGPVGRPDTFYAKVAATYVSKLEANERPTQGVADEYKVSHSRARDLIREARGRGLLTGTKRGQAGGDLTAKARTLLLPNSHKPSKAPAKGK